MRINEFIKHPSIEELSKQSKTIDEFVDEVISLFKKDRNLYHTFLKEVFFVRLERYFLLNIFPEKNSISQDMDINLLIPIPERKQMLLELQNGIDLLTPRLVLPKWKFFMMLGLILVPILAIVSLAIYDPSFLIVIFELTFFGGLILYIFSLIVIIHFIKPTFFTGSYLLGIRNFSDLVREIVILNYVFFEINDFEKTRIELREYARTSFR